MYGEQTPMVVYDWLYVCVFVFKFLSSNLLTACWTQKAPRTTRPVNNGTTKTPNQHKRHTKKTKKKKHLLDQQWQQPGEPNGREKFDSSDKKRTPEN